MTEIKLDIHKIDNDSLIKYITENINGSQFDETEKIKPIIKALLSDYKKEHIEEVNELFYEITSEIEKRK